MRVMGEDEMATWFEQADGYVPEAKLYINDFGILNGPRVADNGHAQEYLRVIRKLIDDDAPLEAIGFQSHFGSLVPIPQLIETIAAFEPFGKRMAITEFDARVSDEQAYADYLRDFLTLAYSHPQFDAFIMWGFWDKYHWLKNAPLYGEDWTPKPGLKVWEDLVLGEWKTDEIDLARRRRHRQRSSATTAPTASPSATRRWTSSTRETSRRRSRSASNDLASYGRGSMAATTASCVALACQTLPRGTSLTRTLKAYQPPSAWRAGNRSSC